MKYLIILVLFMLLLWWIGATILKKATRQVHKIKTTKRVKRVVRDAMGLSTSCVIDLVQTASVISGMEMYESTEPKSVGGATDMYLVQITKDFPDFHNNEAENALKIFITEYLAVVYEGKDFEHANVEPHLKDIIEKIHQESEIADITFNRIAIGNYVKTGEYATITYLASVGFNKGSQRVETRYKADYTLKLTDDGVATEAMICPNCGATIEKTSWTKCEYCDAKIIRNIFMSWVWTSLIEN